MKIISKYYGLFLILSLFVREQNSYAQVIDAQYLNPKLIFNGEMRFIRFGNSSEYYGGFMWNETNTTYGDGNDFSIFSYSNRDISIRPDGTGNFIVFPTSGGNMGVGIVTPEAKMHIQTHETGIKTQHSSLVLEANDGHMDIISSPAATWGSTLNLVEGNGAVNTDVWSISRQTTNGNGDSSLRLNFGKANHHMNPNIMALQSDGDVGIGTTSPDAKLTVKGKIHAEEVKVDLSVPAPDYVFKADYDLRTLTEVENHIKEKGHLPNIPSANEMEAEGVELGIMNMKLLEKIEELTLYVIELKKEINQLKDKKE